MTCYEIVTGCIPYDGLGSEDTISQILQGGRPELPHELLEFVRNILVVCWHPDPLERPTFLDICMALKLKKGPNPVNIVIDIKSQRCASIVKVEQWNNPQPLTLLEVMQKLMDMDLSILKASASSSTEMITQYFEVIDCKGKKVVNDKSIAKITKALSSPIKMKWINENLGTSIDGNTIVQMHVVEVIVERRVRLFPYLSAHLVATNFQVHSTACWTREGRVECVIYVEGASLGTLLWELRNNRKYFGISEGRAKIIVHRVVAEEFSHLNRRLHNLKSMDLTPRHSPSNIRVHHIKALKEDFCPIEVAVCLEKGCQLVDVSRNFTVINYKIYRASINYPGPYVFLKGKVNKSEDIDVRTLGEDESENMIHRILDISTERGCPEGNGQLIVCGPSEELYDDLVRSLRMNDLVVIGGEVCRDELEFGIKFLPYPFGSLEFFVIEKPTMEVG